ncbi:hypothetical protein E2C01_076050 [Portunus trituberculatus]|uniref:Uncharacterized protein n=1 Tax=Portunus trituberculatus TaxID=210409 RepID=A0A5B7IM86_PORTR|nr:hypothetical protein [Portunus trituberculatus]
MQFQYVLLHFSSTLSNVFCFVITSCPYSLMFDSLVLSSQTLDSVPSWARRNRRTRFRTRFLPSPTLFTTTCVDVRLSGILSSIKSNFRVRVLSLHCSTDEGASCYHPNDSILSYLFHAYN